MHRHLSFSTKAGHYCSVQTLLNLRKSNIFSFCPVRCTVHRRQSVRSGTVLYLLMFYTSLVFAVILWRQSSVRGNGKEHKFFSAQIVFSVTFAVSFRTVLSKHHDWCERCVTVTDWALFKLSSYWKLSFMTLG